MTSFSWVNMRVCIGPQNSVLLWSTEALWSRAVSVLAERWTRTRQHPETWSAVAIGYKSTSNRVSTLAQCDKTSTCCSLQCRHYSNVLIQLNNFPLYYYYCSFTLSCCSTLCMTYTCLPTHFLPFEITCSGQRVRKQSQVCPLWPVAVRRRGCPLPPISLVPQEARLHAATDPSVLRG